MTRGDLYTVSELLPTPISVAGVRFLPPFVCVTVLLHNISKADATRITKLDSEMFHDESWKPAYFGVRRSRSHRRRKRGPVGPRPPIVPEQKKYERSIGFSALLSKSFTADCF